MEKKILMAVDGSDKCLDAVSTVGQILRTHPDFHVLLYHCVKLRASLYPGELHLSGEKSFDSLSATQETGGKKVLEEARRVLLETGFPEERIQIKFKPDSVDIVQDILDEAKRSNIQTIALGRRGLGWVKSQLLGTVSGNVAHYSKDLTVWIIDTPVHKPKKVLLAVEGVPECHVLTEYASEYFAPLPDLSYSYLNIIPSLPPTFWDDGHILTPAEIKEREAQMDRWRAGWRERVNAFMAEGREFLVEKGVPVGSISTRVETTKEGIARDLLEDIAQEQYLFVVIGKKSFQKRTPFLIGSHADKLLHNVKGAILCVVG